MRSSQLRFPLQPVLNLSCVFFIVFITTPSDDRIYKGSFNSTNTPISKSQPINLGHQQRPFARLTRLS